MASPFPASSSVPGKGRVVARTLANGISSLETVSYQYPLKLVSPSRPSETKSVLLFLLSYGGGLVGGDQINLLVEVQPHARLSIVTQGYTKIFKSAARDIVTRQNIHVRIAKDAALCLLPDPVQPFKNSVYEQTQVFSMAANGSLCLLDWLTQGRSARGENWNFSRWVGRNEIWAVGLSPEPNERLVVRDALILDGDQSHTQLRNLSEAMHGKGIFGTLILRGPLLKALGAFFLAEFAALPRLGARDWRSDEASHDVRLSELETWRLRRLDSEKSEKFLWSAANVRGCVVVKFGAPAAETGRAWLRSMLVWEGSILENFGSQALMCLQ